MTRVNEAGRRMSTVIGHSLVRHSKSQKKSSEVIHRSTCRFVKGRDMLPWDWAEGRSVSEWVGLGWFRPCDVCRPDLGGRES